ncbi:putative transcription factor WD40-like family [Dioscorea sansibarensis]
MSPILIPLLLLLLPTILILTTTTSTPTSIVFTTLGRSRYNFDIFSTPIPLSSPPSSLQLTDGISVNFNGFFLPDSSLLFVSERNSSFNFYILPSPSSSSPHHRSTLQLLPFSPLLPSHPSFRDRPILFNDHLIYVSTHIPSSIPRQSWSSIYSTHLPTSTTLRLTPPDVPDFSPSLSPSGLWTAVSSSGSHPWSGQIQDLFTDIYIFKTLDGSSRTLLLKHGAWPSWSSDDSTLFFHRSSSDGWWSIYRATLLFPSSSSPPSVYSITRVTPPGFHAFTPAASPSDPSTLAIATRRSTSHYRHIELVHLRDGVAVSYHDVTRLISPNAHHFNPFISPDGSQLGYHRCRGRGDNGDPSLLLENINSPDPDSFSLFRIDGSFPSFSPSGDRIAYVGLPGLFVVSSDGSAPPVKAFDGNVFPTAWDWKRPGVIYTSYGQEFATESTRVDIISVTLNEDEDEPPVIKKLTENGENNAFPSPSPDGESLVFRSGRSGHKNLYIMDSKLGENARLQRLTEGPWTDTMCNWSPDGDWIAFASDRDNPGNGSFAIYMIHPNGTGLRKVVQSGDGGRANHPWFSPDSKRLAFTSDYAGVSAEPVANPHHYQPYGDIFTVAIDGSDIRRLTHNSYEDGTPTWAPISLKPANVPENLGAGDKCSFEDCHWLNVDNQALPSAVC